MAGWPKQGSGFNQQLVILAVSRADLLAVQAPKTVSEVLTQCPRGVDQASSQRRGNRDAASWRFSFALFQRIGRANRQSKAIFHALVGQLDESSVRRAQGGTFQAA